MVVLGLAAIGSVLPECLHDPNLAPLDRGACAYLGQATDYLPDPGVYHAYKKLPSVWASDLQSSYQSITRLQFPASCTGSASGWYLHRLTDHGFAYNIQAFARLAGAHWERGMPLVVNNYPYRFNPRRQCGAGWSCFFSPLSNCSLESIPLGSMLWQGKKMTSACEAPHGGRFDVQSGQCVCKKGWVAYGGSCEKNPNEEEKAESVDYPLSQTPASANFGDSAHHYDLGQPALKMKYGVLWWLGHLSWYLLKDSPQRPELERFVRQVGLTGEPCLAMHIRKGDSCADLSNPQNTCPPVSSYVERARYINERYGPFTHTYVATDDTSTVQEVQRSLPGVIAQSLDRGVFNRRDQADHVLPVDNNKDLNSEERVREFMNDIWAMGSCQAFVGTFTSSVSMLAYTTQVMRSGHYVPFASMDLPFENRQFLKSMGDRGVLTDLVEGSQRDSFPR